jgi:peptidoglycan/xylan/chitin deacetylase (PgdA/CDA1 family)
MFSKGVGAGAAFVVLMLIGEAIVLPTAGNTEEGATENSATVAPTRGVFSVTPLPAQAEDLELGTNARVLGGTFYADGTAGTLEALNTTGPRASSLPIANAAGMVIADLDGDGVEHVVTVTTDGHVAPPDIGGTPLPLPPLGGQIEEVEALDVDGDPADELALVSDDESRVTIVDLFEGAFSIHQEIELPHPPASLTTGDVIVGGPEEVVAIANGTVSIAQLQGDVSTVISYPIEGATRADIGRIDGDLSPDLAVAHGSGFTLLHGDGDGGFTAGTDASTEGDPIDIDIVPRGTGSEIVVATPAHLWSFYVTDATALAEAIQIPGTTDHIMLEAVELNDDEAPDLVVLEDGGHALTVLRTNRPPVFKSIEEVNALQDEELAISLEAVDPDGDAIKFDVVDAPGDCSLDRYTGTFSWTPNATGTTSLAVGVSDWSDRTTDALTINVSAKQHLSKVTFVPLRTRAVTRTTILRAEVHGVAERVSFAWSRPDGSTWHQIHEDKDGSDGWNAAWNTGQSNGPFRLRTSAFYNGETSTDTTSILVDNRTPDVQLRTAEAFSPNRDGTQDSLVVRARASEKVLYDLQLRRKGRVLRRWSWQSTRRRIFVRWDGRAEGARLRDGTYRFYVRVIDRVQRKNEHARTTTVDTKGPSFRWRRVPDGLVTDSGRLLTRYAAVDRRGPVRVRLKLFHAGRVAAAHTAKLRARRGRWSIRPRYPHGGALVPGSYALRGKVTDRAGNTRYIVPKRWDYAPPRRARAYMRLENTGRQLALTFDDCNYGTAWRSILDTLKAHDVKGTFFCGGTLVRRFPYLARRTVAEGHDGASHGYNHLLMTSLSSTAARSEIMRDRDAWRAVTGQAAVPFFRPPYGDFDGSTLSIAGSLGFSRLMMWDVDTLDWRTQSAVSTSSHVQSRARPGSVVLMHVLPSTAAALPAILRSMKARGMRPVTLTKLFRSAGHH